MESIFSNRDLDALSVILTHDFLFVEVSSDDRKEPILKDVLAAERRQDIVDCPGGPLHPRAEMLFPMIPEADFAALKGRRLTEKGTDRLDR